MTKNLKNINLAKNFNLKVEINVLVEFYCDIIEKTSVGDVTPHPRNPNTHSDVQIELLSRLIEARGWRLPLTVSKRSGYLVRGHGRLAAAKLLGLDFVPVSYQDYASDAEELSDLIADNQSAELSSMDNVILKDLVNDLSGSVADLEELQLTCLSLDDLEALAGDLDAEIDDYKPESYGEKNKEIDVDGFGDDMKLVFTLDSGVYARVIEALRNFDDDKNVALVKALDV